MRKSAQISSLGRFRNKNGKVYAPRPGAGGYCRVQVGGNSMSVHRLVAECFLPPRKGAECARVEHIDRVKHNNRADNLRWVPADDSRHARPDAAREPCYSTRFKPVKARRAGEAEWAFLFQNANYAATSLGVCNAYVTACCNKNQKTSGGYEFEYDEVSAPSELPGEEWRVHEQSGCSVSSFGRRMNDKTCLVSMGYKNKSGYMQTIVGGRVFKVHHMVAEAFGLSRAPGQDAVVHIDGDHCNNRLENLKWATHREAQRSSLASARGTAEKLSQSVEVLRGEEVVAIYSSVTQAAEALGVYRQNISSCLTGRQHSTGGFRFRKAPAEAGVSDEVWVDIPA